MRMGVSFVCCLILLAHQALMTESQRSQLEQFRQEGLQEALFAIWSSVHQTCKLALRGSWSIADSTLRVRAICIPRLCYSVSTPTAPCFSLCGTLSRCHVFSGVGQRRVVTMTRNPEGHFSGIKELPALAEIQGVPFPKNKQP